MVDLARHHDPGEDAAGGGVEARRVLSGIDRSSASAFAKVAESYERRRPSYPDELVAWVVEQCGIGPGTTVADVGAGTGKLTRQLVPTGAHVIAVEPLPEMGAQLAAVLPEVELITASGEELPLADASADAITVAAAIHWFDLDRALPELHRVLKPGGSMGIFGPGRDLQQPLQQEVQAIIGPYLPDSAGFGVWRDEIRASGLFTLEHAREVPYDQLLDAEGLEERVATISYIARLPDDVRAGVLEQIRTVGEAQPESPFPFRYCIGAMICARVD